MNKTTLSCTAYFGMKRMADELDATEHQTGSPRSRHGAPFRTATFGDDGPLPGTPEGNQAHTMQDAEQQNQLAALVERGSREGWLVSKSEVCWVQSSPKCSNECHSARRQPHQRCMSYVHPNLLSVCTQDCCFVEWCALSSNTPELGWFVPSVWALATMLSNT